MGRLTEIIAYLNAEKHPSAIEVKHYYHHLTIDEHTKEVRRKYRKEKGMENDENNK